MKEILIKFIKDNKLTFEEGRRNTDLVVICGFTCYKHAETINGISIGDSIAILKKAILETCPKTKSDTELMKMLDNTINYAWENNYEDWWTTKEAKETWKFDTIE